MLPTFRTRSLFLRGPAKDTVIQQLSQQSALRRPGNFQTRKFTLPQTAPASLRDQISSPALSRWRTPAFRRTRGVRYSSKTSKPPLPAHGSTKGLGISARFKELSRRYGWAAVGVYFGLSAIDFPFCYLAVRWLGTDRVAAAEHFVVENFWKLVGMVGLDVRKVEEGGAPASGTAVKAGEAMAEETDIEARHEGASIWTQLLLAYGVHKSLIFFRVPLTAAVTPKVVKWLRARGFNIGKKSSVTNTPTN